MKELVTVAEAGVAERKYVSSDVAAQRVMELAKKSVAGNTVVAYDRDWRIWEAWCAANGASAMPAEEHAVADFLAEKARRKNFNGSPLLASVCAIHARNEHAFDKHNSIIRFVLDGARNEARERKPRRMRMISVA